MRGIGDHDQSGKDVHGSYADPRASLLVGCLDQSTWTETVRLGATAHDACSWLAEESNIHVDAVSEYTAEWRSGTARFRFQLLEVPPLDRKGAEAWGASRRWKKQPHRLFVSCLLSVEPGETGGMMAVNRALRRMVADLDGEYRNVGGSPQARQGLKGEMKLAHAVPLSGIDPATAAPPPKSADWDAVEAELTSVPMTSAEKPDINGFREGERVRLVSAFVGDSSRYEVGHEGTVLVTNTSPADVRLCREGDLHEVLMDKGGIVMTAGKALKKIPGHAEVIYSTDGETVRVKL